MTNKASLSEQDVHNAGWDASTQVREEVALTSGRVIVCDDLERRLTAAHDLVVA